MPSDSSPRYGKTVVLILIACILPGFFITAISYEGFMLIMGIWIGLGFATLYLLIHIAYSLDQLATSH